MKSLREPLRYSSFHGASLLVPNHVRHLAEEVWKQTMLRLPLIESLTFYGIDEQDDLCVLLENRYAEGASHAPNG